MHQPDRQSNGRTDSLIAYAALHTLCSQKHRIDDNSAKQALQSIPLNMYITYSNASTPAMSCVQLLQLYSVFTLSVWCSEGHGCVLERKGLAHNFKKNLWAKIKMWLDFRMTQQFNLAVHCQVQVPYLLEKYMKIYLLTFLSNPMLLMKRKTNMHSLRI